MYDVIIIGSGIIGSFIAYDLSKYNLKILVLEKENDVANVTTMANSAIVHAGYDPEDDTLKALLNVKGSKMYKTICNNLNVPYKKIGAYVVGSSIDDEEVLKTLKARAIVRGVKYEELDKNQLHTNEPNLADKIYCGLSFPDTAIIDPFLTAITLMDVAVENGVEVKLNQEVISINNYDTYEVITTDSSYKGQMVINAAGLASDKIAAMVNDFSYKIKYFKGEYYVLDKACANFVNHVIYPVPTKVGKGVLVVPTVHENTMLGPTSEETKFSYETNTTTAGLQQISEKLLLIVKDVPFKQIIRSFAGIRAKVDTKDFIIEESHNNKKFINIVGIDSPGIASAPAISEYVIDKFVKKELLLDLKKDYKIKAKKYINLNELSLKEKNEIIKKNPKYGKIICRCEQISEQEIIDNINRPLKAITIKALKKRCRPGMGKCQGGFCQPVITKILADNLNCDMTEINYDSKNSQILKCDKGDMYD